MLSIVLRDEKPETETRKGKRVDREILGGIRPQMISE